jgi:hypothetical protein
MGIKFWLDSIKESYHSEDIGVDGRIILKRVSGNTAAVFNCAFNKAQYDVNKDSKMNFTEKRELNHSSFKFITYRSKPRNTWQREITGALYIQYE